MFSFMSGFFYSILYWSNSSTLYVVVICLFSLLQNISLYDYTVINYPLYPWWAFGDSTNNVAINFLHTSFAYRHAFLLGNTSRSGINDWPGDMHLQLECQGQSGSGIYTPISRLGVILTPNLLHKTISFIYLLKCKCDHVTPPPLIYFNCCFLPLG